MPGERRRKKNLHQGDPGTSHQHSFSVEDIEGAINHPVPAFIHRVSGDRRRVYVEELSVDPPSPVKRMRREALQPEQPAPLLPSALESRSMDSERYQLGFFDYEEPYSAPSPTLEPPRVVKPSDPSLSQWRAKRDAYLSALICRDGTGDDGLAADPYCPTCSTGAREFRCRDCFGDVLYCRSCIVQKHRENPLHRIEKWHSGRVDENHEDHNQRNQKLRAGYFVRTSLAFLGLRVQLGHHPHETCTAPEPGRTGFIVLHTNGIHEVRVDFCGCEGAEDAGSSEIQLLRGGWFPATHERPQTCATITVLERFHQDTLQSKMTMYDFYGVLEKLTDNTGIKAPDRYHEWIRMCREFRHLMLLKRGGRMVAYSSSGVEGTRAGRVSNRLPSVPTPEHKFARRVGGRASGAKVCPSQRTIRFRPTQDLMYRFLYTLFIVLDACFRLKQRLVSSELKDPDLGPGWAYMVETEPYREYLRGVTSQKEMNTCSGLAALDYANTKFSRGYSTTGVGMGVCARHEFVQPNGVGDLQKGERFSNMDYVIACILILKHPRLRKLLTYDIACIWSVHLLDRLKKLPPHVRLVIALAFVRFAIPKMHIHSHKLLCHLLYSLNYILGGAQLDAEGIERAWAGIGGVAASTRDMGPGARHDVLDCQWSHWNWQKLVGIVELLRRRRDRAKEELAEQMQSFEEFSAQQADRVPEWRRLVLEFELDNKKKNPYEIEVKGLTEAEVRLQFTKEEAEEAARGVPPVHDVSPSAFITAGLDLEEEQRRVRLQAELKKAATTGQQIDLAAMRTKLNRGIARFRKIQRAYMPIAVQLLADMDLPPNTLAEDVPLLLPSALTEAQRSRCAAGLEHVEGLLRDAQCRTALTRLRNQLHIKSRLLTYKQNHVRHQGANTKSRTIITRNESKIRLHSEKYQTAWEAMRKLSGGDAEQVGWRVLKREDIRRARDAKRREKTSELRSHGLLPAEEDDDMDWQAEDDPVRGPENRYKVSWIWAATGTEGTDAGLDKALQVEWSKAFARTRRWDEEVRLLDEEFRRVCVSFEFEADKWQARAAAVPVGVLRRAEAEGAVAYVFRHAGMFRDLRERAIKTWNEEKLTRGKKRPRHIPAVVAAMEAEERAEQATRAEGRFEDAMRVEGEEEEEDDESGSRGDVQSDEEYILGGEGYDD
ncbi:CxC2 domain-containing protein [Mycena sanguinolenta]|uniref:CxC2 domain-containing protein n=1 Tax=Mycena sanguinolenta TaxID=230812 RepID=A0A8H6XUH9_9AGAR|nr:CxC2 domain-containing protein [Mycena sanguinolenta]